MKFFAAVAALAMPFVAAADYTSAAKDDQNIFYMYVESENAPASDPVVLWTNGGPGCSGLLGLFTEQGPFVPQSDGTVAYNEFAWSKVANMLFVEQPAGVGFSYGSDDDMHTGDDQAAVDNHQLILSFLERFPEVQANPFFITSESYGGHYMPTLAKEIVDNNADGAINFKGFAVGNPYTNAFTNKIAQYTAQYQHGALPAPLFNRWLDKCARRPSLINLENCTYLEGAMMEKMGNGINPYALDYPVCVEDAASSQALTLMHAMHEEGSPAKELLLPVENYEPCAEDFLLAWINTDEVKEAMHAKTGITWGSCSSKVRYSRKDMQKDMAPLYNYLIDGGYGLKILVYSGDDDSVCATSGTDAWIWDLGYETIAGKYWRDWKVDEQVAGYVSHFEDGVMTYATVHGAGHEVPTYKPKQALDLLQKFLSNEW
ncbi:hypothetical protein TeGR_g1485 [Tetraparma gracilis]|uniref:Carboxypeptidase n=1 Tax=Tetraparma gracilis TaxID=2962635 RepID=A0ABQ6N4Z0_9STRA|nr:hypothetical protein TeGR_g1485 [Tetraparma gracilis]